MAAKLVDEAQSVLRYSDLPAEPRRMLPPILGYEKMPLVSLEEAIHPLIPLVPEVERMAWTAKQSHFDQEHDLTEDEVGSILLYTMEWVPVDNSFYFILNNTLQVANRTVLQPWFLYLRLIMTALAKLPSNSPRLIVFRGVKLDLIAQYPQGSMVTWWGFSSCTTSIGVLNDERFLGRTGTRTLFNIDCHSAKRIKQFSYYPKEEEVLLPPGRQFQVMGCLNQGNGLHIIQLKEIQPKFPLINPILLPSKDSSSHKQQPAPPIPVQPAPKTSQLPHCDNLELQKHIDALYSDSPLTQLCLINSQIGDREVQCLANALQNNKLLITLVLITNHIGPQGALYLATVLQNNETLTTLNLNSNQIGPQGAQHLANALQKNKTLTILNIGENQIGDNGAQYLASALKSNNTLTTLNIGHNQIGSQGAQYLATTLQQNETLTTLYLMKNHIDDSGIQYFANALQTNRKLTILNFHFNQIGDKGALYLANALENRETLLELNIWGNRLSSNGNERVTKIFRKNPRLKVTL